jgi:hypothetical protein
VPTTSPAARWRKTGKRGNATIEQSRIFAAISGNFSPRLQAMLHGSWASERRCELGNFGVNRGKLLKNQRLRERKLDVPNHAHARLSSLSGDRLLPGISSSW